MGATMRSKRAVKISAATTAGAATRKSSRTTSATTTTTTKSSGGPPRSLRQTRAGGVAKVSATRAKAGASKRAASVATIAFASTTPSKPAAADVNGTSLRVYTPRRRTRLHASQQKERETPGDSGARASRGKAKTATKASAKRKGKGATQAKAASPVKTSSSLPQEPISPMGAAIPQDAIAEMKAYFADVDAYELKEA